MTDYPNRRRTDPTAPVGGGHYGAHKNHKPFFSQEKFVALSGLKIRVSVVRFRPWAPSPPNLTTSQDVSAYLHM